MRAPIPAVAAGPPSRSRRTLCAFVGLAALLHGVLLGGLDIGIGGELPARPGAALSVRTIVSGTSAMPAAVAEPALPPVGESVAPTLATPAGPPPQGSTASARSRATPRGGAEAGPSALPMALPVEGQAAAAQALETAAPEPGGPSVATASPPPQGMLEVALDAPPADAIGNLLAAGEQAPPVYPTVLPAPAHLRYELRRGFQRGTGEIRWRPGDNRYSLQFEARLGGLILVAQSSHGNLGPAGIAPVRFTDQRARKSARSVNFGNEANDIRFSATTRRWALLAGTQDRLSWMIQLGGIVAAEPALADSGAIAMVLVSARGEAAVRTVRFAGRESAETAGGDVSTLKFVVEGHSAHDGSFEIWLDPALGYLPARAVSRGRSGEAEFELLLQRVDP